MKITEKIKKPIVQELKIFEKQFYSSVSSKIKLLDLILIYVLNRKGKQIRPILVFLFAKMFSKGNINEKSYRAANLVELIHTASLIHDDIVDDSNVRRNFLTINALWKNRISVLVGDFFLSKALLLSTENKDYDLLNEVSKAVKEISEGELFFCKGFPITRIFTFSFSIVSLKKEIISKLEIVLRPNANIWDSSEMAIPILFNP